MDPLFARGQAANARTWRAVAIFKPATLEIRHGGDAFSAPIPVRAERRSIGKNDLRVGSGQVSAATTVFHIPAEDVPEEITNHSRLTDETGKVYMLELPRLETNDSRWRCEVVRGV